jgi:hypothetical protein
MTNQHGDIDAIGLSDLRRLVVSVLEENARLRVEVAALREENARLKGLKGKPEIKPPARPSGMDKGTDVSQGAAPKNKRGSKSFCAAIEDKIVRASAVPPGSRFKGYEDFTVEDVRFEARVIRFRRERWMTPEGETIIAPLPAGIDDHVGAELKRFILAHYHQGQTTIPRLVALLHMIGLTVSERQVVRVLNEGKDIFINEAQEVLRAAFRKAATWFSVDDTGARHKGKNGFCTQMGNHLFTFFATTFSKSRLNFLGLLRAGYMDYALNDAAFAYMRKRNLSASVIDRLVAHPERRFVNEQAWLQHLQALGVTILKVHPDPVLVATEGALWGAIADHGFLEGAVILSDDAGQFNIGAHALCWVHAERLIYKLNAFTEAARQAKEQIRGLVWDYYRDLKAYKANPDLAVANDLRKRFDDIFARKTGFVALDRLLTRLRANKPELLRVLDRPDIPLHTNGSENDIRCQVTRRKISGTTRSDQGRDCRDAFLSLTKTCMKLDISFWDYLGDRLRLLPKGTVPYLPDLVASRA